MARLTDDMKDAIRRRVAEGPGTSLYDAINDRAALLAAFLAELDLGFVNIKDYVPRDMYDDEVAQHALTRTKLMELHARIAELEKS